MNRCLYVLLTLLVLAGVVRAAEPFSLGTEGAEAKPQAQSVAPGQIDAPVQGASMKVSQPHVVAELIPETTAPQPGVPFQIALHLHMDEGWHTYWINPGDAGMATSISWTLPPGFTAGPIQWPTPEKHSMGPLTTYGYGGDAYLLVTITPPQDLPAHYQIKGKAQWLVCQEACIPGKGEFTLTLGSGTPQVNEKFFEQARLRVPVPNTKWNVEAGYAGKGLVVVLQPKDTATSAEATSATFFPEQSNVVSPADTEMVGAAGKLAGEWALQQNCEKPDKLSGVVVSRSPLIGDAKSVYLSSFPVLSGRPAGANIPQTANPSAAEPNTSASQTPPAGAVNQSTADQVMANNFQPANANIVSSSGGSAPPAEPPFLPFVLAAALLGGIILNLMPCVLPVLSLKVFSLIRHAGEDPKAAWKQGAAFTAGVLVSFWVLAGLLIAFNSAGSHLGWGFQMQSPGFVLALILLFFLLGLNLFGVFEIGTSLVGLDAKAAANADRAHLGGLASSFGNGALATLAATPCTAPFMGSALGFAAQQPAYIALLVFTFLALGMAAPYLLLTIFPGALRFVPKPGEWMVSLKQFMGFLLVATAAWLTPIFGRLAGHGWLGWLLIALVFVGMAAWIYGRWGLVRTLIFIPVAGLLLYELQPMPDTWQVWSPQVVQQNLNAGKPVFVDFTADWCLSCKVNERLALGTDAVKNAFADKGVALLRGDWTNSDPAISAELQKYNRAGVPLYLLYSPKAKDAPQVLPEVLTPGIVLDALNKL